MSLPAVDVGVLAESRDLLWPRLGELVSLSALGGMILAVPTGAARLMEVGDGVAVDTGCVLEDMMRMTPGEKFKNL